VLARHEDKADVLFVESQQVILRNLIFQSFHRDGKDASNPLSSLILDQGGNLYGTTFYGGRLGCTGFGCGTVFELSPGDNGSWTEKVLHSFNSKDGAFPGSITFDASGNLYGSASGGQGYGYAIFFRRYPLRCLFSKAAGYEEFNDLRHKSPHL
jgi:uncharacterized repeat protein (TIGR03803 family)